MLCLCAFQGYGQALIGFQSAPGSFQLTATPILIDTTDYWLVRRAGEWLASDLHKVTGQTSAVLSAPGSAHRLIIIGTLDKSPLIRRLLASGKIQVDALRGQWDAFSLQRVEHPFKGIDEALVICGSNKRGAAYGALELSQIGRAHV